jgi:hypothetical protein
VVDFLRKGRQQGSIHVDCDQANGRVHVLSVPGHLRCGSRRLHARSGQDCLTLW